VHSSPSGCPHEVLALVPSLLSPPPTHADLPKESQANAAPQTENLVELSTLVLEPPRATNLTA
jgi:hypothetical protein